jgi:predicted dehydrogenase
MSASLCRWGILGTANIARKNWKAIMNAGNANLVAVASRDRERAQRFIDDCQAAAPVSPTPAACASYAELLARPDIDAVYIPLPTGIRKDWVLRAAEAGKHILCEKPCGVSRAEVRAMLEACRKHQLQFMDGVMFMHSQRQLLLRQVLDDGQSVGKIYRIASQFSFKATDAFLDSNIRVSSDLEPLGCLGDLGWYNVRLSLWLLKEQLPERVSGRLLAQHSRKDSARPVPLEFSGELLYPEGVSASFYCSFRSENQQWAVVSGSQGYVHIHDFVLPFFGSEVDFEVQAPFFRVHGCDHNMESHMRRYAVREYSNSMAESQEANLFRTFSALVLSGQPDPSWGERALKTQQVVDACLQSAREDGRLMSVAE